MHRSFLPLNEALAESEQDDYALLPEPIKQFLSRDEFLWLTDSQKASLIQQECEPEW